MTDEFVKAAECDKKMQAWLDSHPAVFVPAPSPRPKVVVKEVEKTDA